MALELDELVELVVSSPDAVLELEQPVSAIGNTMIAHSSRDSNLFFIRCYPPRNLIKIL